MTGYGGGSSGRPAREHIVAVRALIPSHQIGTGGATVRSSVGAFGGRHVASPLSHYPGREVRTVGGPDKVGHVIVEVESSSGAVGVGVTSGGIAAGWIIEHHLADLVRGCSVDQIELAWDLMWRGTVLYGRKGIVLHAISAVDLALWDLQGKIRDAPVHELIGGPARDHLNYYATSTDAAAVADAGYIGCKFPLAHGMASGRAGLVKNVEVFAEARAAVGDDVFLAYDCWMSMDVERSVELAHALAPFKPAWLEECVLPDDYLAYRTLRERFPREIAVAGGEHEATRWGFRTLTEYGRCDILQPDPTWCGGMTELLRIIDDAEISGRRVVMHGSSAYAAHASMARISVPFAETFIDTTISPEAQPIFGRTFEHEPLPRAGRLSLDALDAPGFGMDLNPDVDFLPVAEAAARHRDLPATPRTEPTP